MPHVPPPEGSVPSRLEPARCSRQRRQQMPKYVIERTVPGAGQMDAAALAAISGKSNEVLRQLGPDIQWVHSYVADDKITCVYVAANEEIIREHGRCGGFPIDNVQLVS